MATTTIHGKMPGVGLLERLRAWFEKVTTRSGALRSNEFTPVPLGERDRGMARHYLHQGREKYKNHDFNSAADQFLKALQYDQNYARAWLYYGNTLNHQGNLKEAIKCWRKAASVEPHSESADTARTKLDHYAGGV